MTELKSLLPAAHRNNVAKLLYDAKREADRAVEAAEAENYLYRRNEDHDFVITVCPR
jgi:hypothetical protein